MTTTVNREYRLRPLRTSSAMAAKSHGVNFRNCLRSNFRRELHRLSPQWQVPPPPPPPRIDSPSRCRGCVTDNPRKGQRRFELFRQGMYRLSRNQHRYTSFGSEDVRGFLCRSQTRSLLAVRELNGGGTPNTAHLGLLLHAPGLTLVTHATACVPSTCVPPTIWKIICPSKKDLG
jgi:hypothetical protein